MKRFIHIFLGIFLLLQIICFQSCIKEYPHPVKGSYPEKGEDPTTMNAFIEVNYDLTWKEMFHKVDFATKAGPRSDKPHRFVLEVINEKGEVLCHDYEFLSADEFSMGQLSHRLSIPLSPTYHQIAVWYDMEDEDGNYSYDSDDLKKVTLSNLSTTNSEILQCAYASDILDLTGYDPSETGASVVKELMLDHPGARFEIVATDIQSFISNNKEALNQGDSFTVHLSFSGNTSSSFNLHSQSLHYTGEDLILSGRMRLPFAEYDALKIAEGFLFCPDEEEISVKLSVTNSALVTVSQTQYFSFPIKKGYITTVEGDFLSHPIDGIFSIDNIWDGEIVIEI